MKKLTGYIMAVCIATALVLPLATVNAAAAGYSLTDLHATDVDYHMATIAWKPLDTGNAEDILNYRVERATSKNGKYKTVADKLETAEYTNTGLTAGKSYYYRVKAYRGGTCLCTSGKLKLTTRSYKVTGIKLQDGFHHKTIVSWTPMNIRLAGEEGYETITYKLLRATSKNGKYKVTGSTTDAQLEDTGLAANKTYYYIIKAYRKGKCVYTTSKYKLTTRGYKVSGFKAWSDEFRTIELKWNGAEADAGEEVRYELMRSTSKKGTYKSVAKTADTAYTNTGLTPDRTYYYKLKVYVDGSCVYTTDPISAKVLLEKVASIEIYRKGDGSTLDVALEIGEDMYSTSSYNVQQGGCVRDGYAYLALLNKGTDVNGTKCRIVKMNVDTQEITAVSEPILVYHANCLTYDTRKDLILATACQVKGNRAIYVDPETLEVVSYKDIGLTSAVKNLPDSVLKAYKGFTAITYDEKNDRYLGRLRDDNNLIELDNELNPVRYIVLEGKRTDLTNQSVLAAGDYFYDVRSFKGSNNYNLVTVHDFKGTFVGQVRISVGDNASKVGNEELEFIDCDNGTFYGAFYRSLTVVLETGKTAIARFATFFKVLTGF